MESHIPEEPILFKLTGQAEREMRKVAGELED